MSFNFKDLDCSFWIPKDFSFIKSTCSLAPFKSLLECVVVCGTYAIAAVILPWMLEIILAPFGFSLMLIGAIAMAAGIYHFLSQNNHDVESWNNHTRAGAVILSLGLVLSFSPTIAPVFILGLALYRIYGSLSSPQIDDTLGFVNNLTSSII